MGFGVDEEAGSQGGCRRVMIEDLSAKGQAMGFGVDVLAFGAGGGVFEMGT